MRNVRMPGKLDTLVMRLRRAAETGNGNDITPNELLRAANEIDWLREQLEQAKFNLACLCEFARPVWMQK
jgi:hypothetical protein